MTNSEVAFPSIQIQCADRKRNFCMNMGAFRALEQHLKEKLGDPNFSIMSDFNWLSDDMDDVVAMIWAGLFTDAQKNDSEVFTIEKALDIVDLLGMSQAQGCIMQSLARVMSKEQFAKLEAEGKEKKTKIQTRLKQAVKRKNRK